jgi:hypothetical protein
MSADQPLIQPQSAPVEGTFQQPAAPVDNSPTPENTGATPPYAVNTTAPEGGTEYVDIPVELKPRFNRLYHNMKEYERENATLRQHVGQLTQAVNEWQASQATNAETIQRQQLMARMVQAKEQGNVAEEVRLQGELATLGQRVQKPAPLAPPPAPVPPEVTYVSEWSREVGQDGNFRRPWALEGHPRYAEAYNFIANLTQDPRYSGNTDAILAAADRHMGLSQGQPRPPGAAVLSGGQVRPSVDSEVQLSPDQLRIAQKLGIAPKAYAAQQAMINKYGNGYAVTNRPKGQAK